MLMATSLGEVEILREFLTRYPEMVNFTSDGRTALHCAASAGLVEPLKILIEFKADIEQMVGITRLPIGTHNNPTCSTLIFVRICICVVPV